MASLEPSLQKSWSVVRFSRSFSYLSDRVRPRDLSVSGTTIRISLRTSSGSVLDNDEEAVEFVLTSVVSFATCSIAMYMLYEGRISGAVFFVSLRTCR